MNNGKAYDKVVRYLLGTEKVSRLAEKSALLSNIDGYTKDRKFLVTPWDLSQVCLNTGLAVSEARDVVLSKPDDFFLESAPEEMEVIRSKKELGNFREHASRSVEKCSSITVLDCFKWYLYHKIKELSQDGSKLVSIRDGIFAIKNELFLPDDFVPKVMMEMVEGSKLVDVQETRDGIQPSSDDDAIYLYGLHDKGKFLEPQSFYFNPSPSGEVPEDLGKLGEKLSKSFSDFQKTDAYENFLFSRIMRNVIFTVERKHNTEFKKPLFDSSKLMILAKNGIASVEGELGTLTEGLSVDDLERKKKEAENAASNVADLWMESRINL